MPRSRNVAPIWIAGETAIAGEIAIAGETAIVAEMRIAGWIQTAGEIPIVGGIGMMTPDGQGAIGAIAHELMIDMTTVAVVMGGMMTGVAADSVGTTWVAAASAPADIVT